DRALQNALAYHVELGCEPLPLFLGVSVHPIHVDINIEVTNAAVRFIFKSGVVADHRADTLTAEELVQRRDDLALADVPLARSTWSRVLRRALIAPFSAPARLVSTSWNLDRRTTSCSFQKPLCRIA